MKRKFKAFTLIELIVVIAIFGIIMSGLMNFYRPIRETYVDSTMYEKQRTVHDGIIEYLSETTRYATKLTVYDEGAVVDGKTINTGKAAYEAFCNSNGYDISTTDRSEQDDLYRIRIICINRKDGYTKTGDNTTDKNAYHGRLITNIVDQTTEISSGVEHLKLSGTYKWNNDFDDTGARTKSGGEDAMTTYMALGGGYYGNSDYAIYVNDKKSSSTGITFGVVSQSSNSNGNVVENSRAVGNSKLDTAGKYITLTTEEANLTKNLAEFNYELAWGSSEPFGTLRETDKTTINGHNKNTWIVFTVPDEGDR